MTEKSKAGVILSVDKAESTDALIFLLPAK